jgi:hypoxanthine-DNA glycosylase
MDYAAKTQAVQRAGIAIWDVYASCVREGSLDAAIRGAVLNDFRKLKKLAPRLTDVCFNGQTAGRFAPQLAAAGYQTAVLPSTSPAYTLSFEQKCVAWQAALLP